MEKDIYNENYETLTKEIEEETKIEVILTLWIVKISIIKMSILHTVIEIDVIFTKYQQYSSWNYQNNM